MVIKPAEKSKSTALAYLWWIPLPAIIAATAANSLFYVFVTQILGFELLVPNEPPIPETVPLPLFDVVFFSVLWAGMAGVVFLGAIAFSQKPVQIYVVISTITLLLSFALPLMMPTDKVLVETKGTLMTMHIIGAFVVVGTLVTLYRRRTLAK
jgi:hypothetical protein